MCLVAAGHPLDLIKVRLQTSTTYTGTLDCFRQTVAKDGVRGLYRGMSAPLAGITPVYAMCFWGYDMGQRLARWGSGKKVTDQLSTAEICFAGGFSALPTTALMTPIERVKCLLQIQDAGGATGGVKYRGPVHAARALLADGGLPNLYRGTLATLLRDVPGSVAYFGAYELVKESLAKVTGKDAASLSPLAILFAGGMAGVANWTVAIPPDVLKSRLQTAPPGTYTGIGDVLVKLLRTDGPKALFRGLGPAMIRAFPANAACFLGVEMSMRAMNRMW